MAVRRANIEPCENGYIVNIYDTGDKFTTSRNYVAKDEAEAVSILKAVFKGGKTNVRKAEIPVRG